MNTFSRLGCIQITDSGIYFPWDLEEPRRLVQLSSTTSFGGQVIATSSVLGNDPLIQPASQENHNDVPDLEAEDMSGECNESYELFYQSVQALP